MARAQGEPLFCLLMLLSPNLAEILSKFRKTEHPSHAALNAISRPKKTRIPWHSSKQTKVLQICVVRATSKLSALQPHRWNRVDR